VKRISEVSLWKLSFILVKRICEVSVCTGIFIVGKMDAYRFAYSKGFDNLLSVTWRLG
jgi:hypothetical protein